MTDAPVHVVLYTKPGCHLCDTARDLLDELAAAPERYQTFMLDEVDILRQPDLFALYRYRIPVITRNGEIVVEGQMDDVAAATLARAFALPGRS